MLAGTTLQSCSGETGPDVTTSADTSDSETTVETGPLDAAGLPQVKFERDTFNVITSKPEGDTNGFSNFEVTVEGENGEVLNDAIYRRNLTIEELLGVKITETVVNVEKTTDFITKAVLSDERLYDLAFARTYEIGALAQEGMFADMNSLEYVNFDKEWWDKGLIDTAEISGKLYFASSDFDLQMKGRIYTQLYNCDLGRTFGIDNIADLVRSGKWTIDKEIEYVKLAAADLNGDGVMDQNDRYGFIAGDMKDLFYFNIAAGNFVARKNSSGEIELSLNNERTIVLIDKWLTMMYREIALFPQDLSGKVDNIYSGSGAIFWGGNCLFRTIGLRGIMSASAKADFDYKMLPLPKFDEAQEKYYTMSDNIGLLFGVPANAPDRDFSGYMLEALSCISHTTTLPAYYEINCKVKSVYDEDSADMMDLAIDGLVFDVGFLYDIGGLPSILTSSIPSARSNDLSSLYAGMESSAKEALKKLNEAFTENK